MSEQMLFVARGRTVILNRVHHGPGSELSLAHDEAEFLASRGFVQTEPPILMPSATTPNHAGIGAHGGEVQGPHFHR